MLILVIYIKAPSLWTSKTTKESRKNDILMSVRAPVGAINICNSHICIGRGLMALRTSEKIDYRFLFYLLKYYGSDVLKKDVENFCVPVPSLEIQIKIADELDGYQKIINGAREVVSNYKSIISTNKVWETTIREITPVIKVHR